jgi:hypothetical protein
MSTNTSLQGNMIPRYVRRFFDQRAEERSLPTTNCAVLGYRDQDFMVRLLNKSPSGAMVAFDQAPNIGETVTLTIMDGGPHRAFVRWVREGQIGLQFR